MAHKLHLAITHSFKNIPYFKHFDDLINSVYKFYNSHGHKRKAHLRKMAEVLDYAFYEFNYIFKVRWVASELNAIKKINLTWNLLITDLEAISVDSHFNSETQNIAKGLIKKLTGKHFIVILQFLIDILSQLNIWSLQMQQKTGLLVDFSEFNSKIIETFENAKTKYGTALAQFFNRVICSDTIRGNCTLEKYESSLSVRWENIELQVDKTVPKLDTIRDTFLDYLIDEINSYFPEGSLDNFAIFNPKKMPTTESIAISYGIREIDLLCLYFSWNDCNVLLNEWQNLLFSAIQSEKYCALKGPETTTFTFWTQLLNIPEVAWTSKTILLIQTILVLPIGSADAERGFSVMNHIRTSRRSRLTPDYLDGLMRIRINGPNKIEQFPSIRYARAWIRENHMRTDDPSHKKVQSTSLEDNEQKKKYLPESTLF